jgi:hypothetical protein
VLHQRATSPSYFSFLFWHKFMLSCPDLPKIPKQPRQFSNSLIYLPQSLKYLELQACTTIPDKTTFVSNIHTAKVRKSSQMWWHMPAITALRRLRQEKHSSSGVWGDPGQHSKTHLKRKIKARKSVWALFFFHLLSIETELPRLTLSLSVILWASFLILKIFYHPEF